MTLSKSGQALSFVSGAGGQPLRYRTVDGVLAAAAAHTPDALALAVAHQSLRFSFAEMDREVERIARGLVACGLKGGERVGIWAPNCAEWVLTMFAAARAGLVLVNINPAYRTRELEFALRWVGCRALIFAPRFKSSDYAGMLQSLIPELEAAAPGRLECAAFPELRLLVQLGAAPPAGALSFADLQAAGHDLDESVMEAVGRTLDPDDVFNIQFTSGTTGTPKGAALTHFNIVNNGYFVGEGMRLTGADRVCIPVPLYHCFGMVLGVLAAMTHGAASVFPGDGFEPLSVLETVARERCTALHGVPTMFIAELTHPRFKEFDFTSLRTGIMAGSLCPIDLMRRVIRDMHCGELTICYGLTEASPVITQTTTEDTLERKTTTVGRALPHTEVKIIDPNTGKVVPLGENGELCTRGYLVMNGYHNDPVNTATTIEPDGWLHTGDIASMDEHGYVVITGRLKEMIIRGGENIYPREIEEFLYSCPGVKDVQVIGIPSEKYGEDVMAWIIPHEGVTMEAEAVQAFCREQIAGFKVPKFVKFVDSFPTTVTGKVQKFIMRRTAMEEMGLK